jgi:hypothetical protein
MPESQNIPDNQTLISRPFFTSLAKEYFRSGQVLTVAQLHNLSRLSHNDMFSRDFSSRNLFNIFIWLTP